MGLIAYFFIITSNIYMPTALFNIIRSSFRSNILVVIKYNSELSSVGTIYGKQKKVSNTYGKNLAIDELLKFI